MSETKALPKTLDAVIVGAGFGGMYMLHRLRALGLSARILEQADGVGGTWYWNRYPGARCDVESMQYSFSFDEGLQQEWQWSERFAAQPELLRYANHMADRYDLRRDIHFETRVTSAQLRRGGRSLDRHHRPGRGRHRPPLRHGDGLPLRRPAAGHQGHRRLQGRDLPHRLLAA